MAIKYALAFAQTVNGQYNPNKPVKYNLWENEANAVGNTNGFAKALYTNVGTQKKPKYRTPVYLTAHDFRLNIPNDAYIHGIAFKVCAKIHHSSVKIKAPACWFNICGDSNRALNSGSNGKTGWYNGQYRVYPSQYLSTSEVVFDYVMSEKDWLASKCKAGALNKSVMGVDIHFDDVESMGAIQASYVRVKWVAIKIQYEVPEYYLKYTPTNIVENNPLQIDAGKLYNLDVEFGNRTKANGGNKTVPITLPLGTVLEGYSPASANLTSSDGYTYNWVCSGKGLAKNNIRLKLRSNLVGTRKIVSKVGNVEYPFYVNPMAFQDGDYIDCKIESGDINQLRPSCFYFSAKVNSTDGEIIFDVDVEHTNPPDHTKVSDAIKEAYPLGTNGNYLVDWELIQATSPDVNIDWYNSDRIAFNVPANEDVELQFKGCFLPINSGQDTLVLTNMDNNQTYTYTYYSNPFENLELTIKEDKFKIVDHRVINNIDTVYNVIPFYSKNTDRMMMEKQCGFRMHIQERVPYIGCIPIKHAHHDPSSDFSNDGLISQYKNKTYTGKKGELEENRDLKIWLPKQDWTTLEGLAELDRPIPINTVPSAFEGDVLNHRGWAELTKVKVDTKSPLYYRGSLDLIYLTHNINSRFKITKGVKVINEQFDTLMGSVLDSGDEFANTTYINQDGETVTNSTGYFDVDTDGVYIYDSEAVENQRSLISLDNQQYLTIKSAEELPEHFEIGCEWASTRIAEDRENRFERIITLYDGDDKPIIEYEYYDLEFTDTAYYKCTVQCRAWTSSGWQVLFSQDMNLAVDLETLSLTRDVATGELVSEREPYYDEMVDEDEVEGETEVYTFSDYTYGSIVHFKVDMNKLIIIDEGVSGREVYQTVDLDYAPRKYGIYFKNKNVDGDTNDVYNFFDFEASESVLISDFEKDYSDLIVSSFPIPNRLLVFTRASEEGTLYYYKDDGRLFSFIQEPFYMYFCGVDLKANNDVSIFNLNNSYSTFYLQNGLVRIGFNRLNGEVYLAKYDIYSNQYINVSYLQLSNYLDFHIGAYSDDKIEVCAGTTVFTMYRGHPYVVVKHEDEDLQFISVWNKIYGESVNGQALDLPALWELVNYNNMLPTEIGGSNVDVSGWIVDSDDEDEDANINTSLNLSIHNNATVYNSEDVIFDVSGTVTSSGNNVVDENIPTENETYNGFLGTYSIKTVVDNSVPYEIRLYGTVSGNNINFTVYIDDFEGKPIPNKSFSIRNKTTNVSIGNGVTNANGKGTATVQGINAPIVAKSDGAISNEFHI